MTTGLSYTPQEQLVGPVSGSGGSTRLLLSPSGAGLICIPNGYVWCGWELTASLMVAIRASQQGWLATTYLVELAEYGFGISQEEAIVDLLTSLSDYRESLERREERLGPSAKGDLDKLRCLIRRQVHS